MVKHFDELSARREAARQPNGTFGAAPTRPAESDLQRGDVSALLEELGPQTDVARAEMSDAIVKMIDASMPGEADLVNYAVEDGGALLYIREAIGGYGEELNLLSFMHINQALRELGQPYFDFDGDMILNSVDDFGWERTEPYSATRDGEARDAKEYAMERWARAIAAEQQVVIDAIWSLMSPEVESVDFTWDQYSRSLRFAATINSGGRGELSGSQVQQVDTLAAHITHPERSPLQLNQLNGLYRLPRPV